MREVHLGGPNGTQRSTLNSNFPPQDIKIIPVPQHKESGNLCIIFSDLRTLGIVVGLVFMWFLTSFFYYGFFHMIGTLNGTVHWNITIMGIMEVGFVGLPVFVVLKRGKDSPVQPILEVDKILQFGMSSHNFVGLQF